MDKQNSLFDAVVSQKLPEPKAKQRKSKEKKKSYSIGKPEVTSSKLDVNEPEIPKVISNSKHSISIEGLLESDREDFQIDKTEASF